MIAEEHIERATLKENHTEGKVDHADVRTRGKTVAEERARQPVAIHGHRQCPVASLFKAVGRVMVRCVHTHMGAALLARKRCINNKTLSTAWKRVR